MFIDTSILDSYETALGKEQVIVFVRQGLEQLEIFNAALGVVLEAGDAEDFREQVHSAKSYANLLGIKEAGDLAASLEHCSLEDDTTRAVLQSYLLTCEEGIAALLQIYPEAIPD